jgi:hypothetical protein
MDRGHGGQVFGDMVDTFLSWRIVEINGCDEMIGEENVEAAVADCRFEGDLAAAEGLADVVSPRAVTDPDGRRRRGARCRHDRIRSAAGPGLAKVTATLSRDGETLSSGSAAEIMGNPWKSALWLVNLAVERGRVVEPGHALSTGVIGKRIEAEPGLYTADFGELGVIEFEVR